MLCKPSLSHLSAVTTEIPKPESCKISRCFVSHQKMTVLFIPFEMQGRFYVHFEVINWCFWTMVLEKALESPLDCKEIQPVHAKGNQSWIFTGRTDAEAETPILCPPDVKNWLIGKDTDAEKDWGREEKGTTEEEMAWWHHWLNGREFEWTPGVSDGQGGLACFSQWGRKESDMTECLNWTEVVNYQWSDLWTVFRKGSTSLIRILC